MAQTLPTGEQIRFRSAKSGEHILDTYMESVEKGTRPLYDLIGDLFDDSGVFRVANFEFRFDASTDKLQVRVGNFSNSTSGWSDLTTFFSIEGTFSSSTSYNNFDIVTLANSDVYIVHGLSSATTYADEAAFISSSNTEKIVDVSTARAYAVKTDAAVTGSEFSAKEYAQGSQSGTGGSAKDWATKLGSQVDSTDYSAKHWATTGTVATVSSGIANINTVAGAISAVNTVSGISSDVTTVSGINANVTTVAGIHANTTTVAGISAAVSTVAGISTAVSGVNTISSAVSAVNSNATNINAVNSNSSNINTVAGIASNVTTVAGKASLITSDFASDLNTLATTTIIEDLNILATSDIVTDLGILATSANVTNMATLGASGVVGNIASVAGISTEVSAVQAKLTEITGVHGALTAINSVHTNLTNVNAFANTYFISSSAPGSPTTGDLWYDSNNNILKTYNGSAFVTLISTNTTDNISEGSSNLYFTNTRADARADGRITAALAANVTLGGELRGPASFIIDPAAIGDNTGTVVIKGNLQVDGTSTTVNSTTMEVADLNITAAKDAGNPAAANGAGLTIAGANATLTYANADDSWNFNKKLKVNSAEVATDSDVTALAIALGG